MISAILASVAVAYGCQGAEQRIESAREQPQHAQRNKADADQADQADQAAQKKPPPKSSSAPVSTEKSYQPFWKIREGLAAGAGDALRDRDELRRSLSQQIDELDQLYEQWINELRAVQEAEIDPREKRQAGNADTMDQYSRGKDISQLRTRLESSSDSILGLEEADIKKLKETAEHGIAQAREKMKSIQKGESGQ